ncbi:unnamed protein product, partial [Sphacelaria rigidula]
DFDKRLHQAAKTGNLSHVRRALNVGTPDPLDSDGRTPLHVAAEGGHAEVVMALLAASAAVDARDKKGYTPLYLAASEGRLDAVRVLLEASPNVDIPDKDCGYSPLFVAMMKGHHEVMEELLEYGASPGTSGQKGDTPLHLA